MHTSTSVAVLGAGLTGVATALELARRGIKVTLVEQDELPMNRASLRNEGKIHLGLLYANDSSLRSARLQLRGALQFRSLLSRWIGADADALGKSTPFVYLVAKDSVLPPDRLARHYASVQRMYSEYLQESLEYDYLGARPVQLYEACSLDLAEAFFRTDALAAAFRTIERAIDTHDLARFLQEAVRDCALIRFLPRHKVLSVSRANGLLRVEGSNATGAWRLDAEQAVNALWEGRLAVDRSLGLICEPGWVYRLKYRVIARLPATLRKAPSATMVLGRYGDVVIRADGTVYLSWYPLGLAGWSHEIAPPASWERLCRGEVGEAEQQEYAQEILAALDTWYPGIAAAQPLLVDAGVIVAYGRSDVDDAASALHDRSHIGVSSADGYHSVDPGKLTTAPLYAKLAAERVLEAYVAA